MASLLRMPVCQLADAMPASELRMWHQWLQEPRGDDRADFHAASICQMIDRVALMFTKGGHLGTLDSYRLKFALKPVEKIQADNLQIMAAMFPDIIPKEVLQKCPTTT